MFNKLGQGLRWLGEKVAGGASFFGNKVGGALMSLSPVISLFNPVLGAGAASAGAVFKGAGALGDLGTALLRGQGVHIRAVRQTVNGIRSDAAGVRDAYNTIRDPGNPLERRR